MKQKVIAKIIGLEFLIILFYVGNGAFVSIKEPSSPLLQFVMLVPLALGLFIYIALKKNWQMYFFHPIQKNHLLMILPLLFVLGIILVSTKGLNLTSISDLIFMFLMQVLIVAFIEETIFRGLMVRMLLAKGAFTAVFISSLLFGITHALQLLGGQSLEDTIIQIIYALLVGLVLSLLILDGQSIIITIIFHGFNNFFNFMGNVESPTLSGYLIILVLFVYMLVLWKRVKKSYAINSMKNAKSI
ncbi:CPBP family intramembrane metalloprotease [Lysinibacillus sphaericus]|uniref:Abortive infection protein n=3 Tax=Lysinibacillus TaxID=400634 RepID=B1HRI9_LYSSC|nr:MULTISPECIES: CPBP family intramembrane glutamic endopeptidase [Lysinibacillus]MBE5085257.1 CPBP family intramembrane metalloprotease [Bacillus thuringiensis]ACA39274.1 Abortive infection protein [Lysinibacillus sphaericus C3-41]EWH34738.1 abortive phage infection protein [Lysinibacillus sphaericus CBAM5]MCS1398179.1 CPBP family intramembrane metalloprotease [Lysinibacillus sp. PB211]MDR0158208.1 CPBP family intramembrane metalloprotease [Lysinibacillus sphaericus]